MTSLYTSLWRDLLPGGGGADMKVDGDKLEVESFPVKNFHPGRVSNFEPKRPEAWN